MPLGGPAAAAATGVAGISGASGTAAAAMVSSKKEARAMALEPQPRSHQPCRPGAEPGELSARAPSRSPDFRGETRVAVRWPAAGDGAMGRGRLEQGEKHMIYKRSTDGDGCYWPEQLPAPVPPFFLGDQQVYAALCRDCPGLGSGHGFRHQPMAVGRPGQGAVQPSSWRARD